MGNNWPILPLENMATVIDSRHKTPQYSELGYPMVRVVDIKGGELSLADAKNVTADVYADFSKGRDPEIGDLIISRVGSYGNVSYVSSKQKFCLGQNTALIIPKDKDRFLYYALSSPQLRRQIDNMAVGAVQKTISLKSIKGLEVPQPSAQERTNIANFLSFLDDKITLNRQINQTLEQMAQALFKSWFVDFDPVVDNALDAGFFEQDLEFSDELLRRAEARKAVRESADFKRLPEEIRQLFPAAFEECSEPSLGLGGWVPEGWLETKLSELVDTVSKTYPLKTVDEVIFLNTGDIENGNFLHANFSKVDGLPGQAKKSIRKGDILYSEIRPKNKRFAYVGFESNNYVVSTKLMVLRAKDGFHPFFAYFLLTLNQTIDELQRIAELRSGTFPQITFNELSLIKFILPSTGGVMERFVSLYLEPFFEKSSSNRQENESLVNLRDTLLPKLISGEIQFNENEAEIANAVLV